MKLTRKLIEALNQESRKIDGVKWEVLVLDSEGVSKHQFDTYPQALSHYLSVPPSYKWALKPTKVFG